LVLSYINKGKMDGADKIYQSESRAPFENGFYVAPVIFANVQSHHTIAQEEIFGPVLSILTFKDEEEAIRIANGTAFGLSAVLWTGNMGRAHRVMQRIQAGWIVINTTGTPTGGPGGSSMSSGGLKQSGFGLEGGLEGLEGYVTKTAVQVFM
jgi:acyl-CoA reductase-like NAD-dependent aldehyde dehydrogenase